MKTSYIRVHNDIVDDFFNNIHEVKWKRDFIKCIANMIIRHAKRLHDRQYEHFGNTYDNEIQEYYFQNVVMSLLRLYFPQQMQKVRTLVYKEYTIPVIQISSGKVRAPPLCIKILGGKNRRFSLRLLRKSHYLLYNF